MNSNQTVISSLYEQVAKQQEELEDLGQRCSEAVKERNRLMSENLELKTKLDKLETKMRYLQHLSHSMAAEFQ